MPNWLSMFQKAEVDIASTVPLVNDLSSVMYPEDNYANYSSQGYGKSAVVNACIKEIATGVATARY